MTARPVHTTPRKPASSGFTLMELLIVIAMIAILATLAAPSFNTLRVNQKLASTASDLFASTLQARNEAMRLNRQVTIAPMTGNDWKTGWRVYVDMNVNGSYDSGSDTLVITAPPIEGNYTVTGKDEGTPPTGFTFDSRGFLRGVTNGRVVIKSVLTGREKQIIVAQTGRARQCDPTFNSTCAGGN